MIKPNIRPTTYGGYERIINKRIYPYFKNLNIALTELKPIHIQAFYTYLFNELKLKGATVKKYHANILSALSYAEKMDLITSNPAKKVDTPKAQPYVPTFYNKEELQLLFSIIKDTNIKIPILIGAFYGFRREEILGLKWDAIDFENNSITINFTVTEASYDGKHQIVAEAKTKTSSSYRTLPLIPEIKELLIEEKEKQRENKKLFKDCYLNTDNYVCVNEDGALIKPDYLTHKFHEIIVNNKLKPIRLHDLRHSCASLLLKNAVHMKDIQAWLGHSSFNTTANLYAHADKTASENSAKVIGNVLSIATA